ncbi:MAG: adenosine kinase [SAR324 cluster bacterium]|nr:adenosine kinase [SAR324 cluster bacterium]
MKTLDVYGIGNPLIDLLVHVPESFLNEQSLEKNRMYLVDRIRQKEILNKLATAQYKVTTAPGGSCANTMIGICQLGGSAGFTGKTGDDEHGEEYQKQLTLAGVENFVAYANGMTGSSLVLVNPDGSRTMNTCLGMCQDLGENDIRKNVIKNAKILYFTGYLWDTDSQKAAVKHALETAKEHDTQIAMSLSDAFCVNRHTADFKSLLKEYVNIVFCNQEEAFALAETNHTQTAMDYLAENVQTVVLTLGGKGALISNNKVQSYVDSQTVKVIDTTGAGDAFAAGFLYGLTHGQSINECGQIATMMAAEVISQLGPRCTTDMKSKMKQLFS